jgi:hypothetical protein
VEESDCQFLAATRDQNTSRAELLNFFVNSLLRSENCTETPLVQSALMLEKRCHKNSNSHHAGHKHATTRYYAVWPASKYECANARLPLFLNPRGEECTPTYPRLREKRKVPNTRSLDTVALIPSVSLKITGGFDITHQAPDMTARPSTTNALLAVN